MGFGVRGLGVVGFGVGGLGEGRGEDPIELCVLCDVYIGKLRRFCAAVAAVLQFPIVRSTH